MSPKNKVALITGVTGQDGAYLSELLLEKGHEVHGIKRSQARFDLLDQRVVNDFLATEKPDLFVKWVHKQTGLDDGTALANADYLKQQ